MCGRERRGQQLSGARLLDIRKNAIGTLRRKQPAGWRLQHRAHVTCGVEYNVCYGSDGENCDGNESAEEEGASSGRTERGGRCEWRRGGGVGGGGDVRGRYQLCRGKRRKAQVNRIPSSDVADDEAESNGERRRRRRKRGDQNVQG